MKVVIINTAENKGGAAVAANRLHLALRESGIDSKMLVRQKSTSDPNVIEFTQSKIHKKINLFLFFIELLILKFFKKKGKDFSLPWFGPDLSKHPLVMEADIIHLHWVQNSFLSLKNLNKLIKLNKKIVWTLHDMWAFTGGCHYNEGCRKFEVGCNDCPQLRNLPIKDFSTSIFNLKNQLFINSNFTVNALSSWIGNESKKSPFFKNKNIVNIKNCIDTKIFKNYNQELVRKELNISIDKQIILFVSMNIDDERKGYQYLNESLQILIKQKNINQNNIELLAIGRSFSEHQMPFNLTTISRIEDQTLMAKYYSAADVLVVPSIQDNLPNTIAEALCCGTPVVAFNIGGIPDMLNHTKNGYIAIEKNSYDLAKGIEFILAGKLGQSKIEIIETAFQTYNFNTISKAHIQLYETLIN